MPMAQPGCESAPPYGLAYLSDPATNVGVDPSPGEARDAIPGAGMLNVFWAQEADTAAVAGALEQRAEEKPYRPITISLEAGTTGPGGTINWRFTDHFGVRAGMHYFSYEADDIEVEGIEYAGKLRLMSEPIGLDLYPWRGSSFRLTVGVLLNQNRLKGSATAAQPGTTIGIGENEYDVYDIGGLYLTVEQQQFSPFVAIGGNVYLGNKKRWSLMGELGVAYTGSPDIELRAGEPDKVNEADLKDERQQLEDATKDFKFYPILKLGVCFSF